MSIAAFIVRLCKIKTVCLDVKYIKINKIYIYETRLVLHSFHCWLTTWTFIEATEGTVAIIYFRTIINNKHSVHHETCL